MTVNLVCYAHCSMFSQKWEKIRKRILDGELLLT